MFTVKKSFLLLIAISLSRCEVMYQKSNHCYAKNANPYVKMGTRTAYQFIHGRTPFEKVPNCKPVQIWMMIRHGTRYPGRRVIQTMLTLSELRDQIIQNHKVRGYGHLCLEDLENLKRWRLSKSISIENAEALHPQGVKDMSMLGKRIRNNFPELFPPYVTDISPTNYKFRSLSGGRLSSSVKAMMSGLLDGVDIPGEELSINETLFAAYQRCPKWRTEVANNQEHLVEVSKYIHGPEYRKLLSSVSERLGFQDNVDMATVHHMWDMCRYEMAWEINKLSPWCAVFSEEELKVIEYKDYLVDFYKRGYGHEFNIRLGCPPLRDMIHSFQKIEKDNYSYSKEPKGIFNIGRSGSLHLFMTALGLAKDPIPLLSSNFKGMSTYQWSTSEIGSFTANVAVIFYKCDDPVTSNKVKFYLAEKPVDYPGCKNGLCDWNYLKNKFQEFVSNCNDDFCHETSSDASSAKLQKMFKLLLVLPGLVFLLVHIRRPKRKLRQFSLACNSLVKFYCDLLILAQTHYELHFHEAARYLVLLKYKRTENRHDLKLSVQDRILQSLSRRSVVRKDFSQ
ncbi:multiple inositol polyphosphate phosphatase 1-like [Diprion similis]|uniref:multiple inositol polyphosphate phosphatase 1-like n=1 Tax=Diprion similis TaxID=362088 RepID=UPI001EF9A675|nr:multiple inositol polyphosphate phosphatase 1-like [Diprion similis]